MIKQFWNKFCDDKEYIRLKIAIAMILIIIVMAVDKRYGL